MIRTMSMGAGVQTTALLLMDPERYDYIVFADQGIWMNSESWLEDAEEILKGIVKLIYKHEKKDK